MSRTLIVTVAVLVLSNVMQAQDLSAQTVAQNLGARCKLKAFDQAYLGRTVMPEEFLSEITTKCKRGDIIQFPGGHTHVLSKVCDFAQNIVYAPKQILCVYVGQARPDR